MAVEAAPPASPSSSAAPPDASSSPLLLDLPDHLLFEIGLHIGSVGDLHTLLRRTCRRLRALTEAWPAASAPAAGSATVGGGDGAVGGGNDGGAGPQQAVVAAAAAAGGGGGGSALPWSVAADIQARWLVRSHVAEVERAIRASPGDRAAALQEGEQSAFEALGRAVRRGDADVTMAAIERFGGVFSPGPSCCAVAALAAIDSPTGDASDGDRHAPALVQRVLQRHLPGLVALPSEVRASLLCCGVKLRSLELVEVMLSTGVGADPIGDYLDAALDDPDRAAPGASAGVTEHFTAIDLALAPAAGEGLADIAAAMLRAVEAGTAAVTPGTWVSALAQAVERGDVWAGDGLAPHVEMLTRTDALRDQVRRAIASGKSSREVGGPIGNILLSAAAHRRGGAQIIERLLGALPPLRVTLRVPAAVEAVRNDNAAAVAVLLAASPPGPCDPASPLDVDSMGLPETTMSATATGAVREVLEAAAWPGCTGAAAAVLDAGEALLGVEEMRVVLGPGAALCSAAAGGHEDTLHMLLEWGEGRGVLTGDMAADAALAARERGHHGLADQLETVADRLGVEGLNIVEDL